MFQIVEKTIQIGERKITLETGRIARQAGGSILISCEGTQLLVNATSSKKEIPGQSFFPLSVEYIEKYYAAGRVPGGYMKREGRPSEREILTSRLIDRPIRPLFPETFLSETQVVATVVSYDSTVPTAPLGIIGASAALHISDIPMAEPVAGVRIVLSKGKYLINASDSQAIDCELDIMVAGTESAILMVEAGAKFVSEAKILEAIKIAHENIAKLCRLQNEIRKAVGKEKRVVSEPPQNSQIKTQLDKKYGKALKEALSIPGKHERNTKIDEIKKTAKEALVPSDTSDTQLASVFEHLFEMHKYQTMRNRILKDNARIDGRSSTDIRPIVCETSVLKRTHGSALFTRGETQSLGVVTLGTSDDAQKYESLDSPSEEKQFSLHYNMPGYSVGEVKRMGSTGRREIGHGNLAERALKASIPSKTIFPYAIRVVSEITESNGSSSMASVCSGTLALLDAGVPLSEPIAGIAMGLVFENNSYSILSDILGDEDALGDMDFKVAGGKSGVTALQMDIKIGGISMEILEKALAQAHTGRMHILDIMLKTINKPKDLSPFAPRIEQIKIREDKIKDLIGPSGKNIRKIVAESGCKIEVDDRGIVSIASTNGIAAQKAKRMINFITTDAKINDVYLGQVKKLMDFGAVVEFKPGAEGFIHLSHISTGRFDKIEDVIKEGEEVLVKVIELDRTGKVKLSRKDAIGKEPLDGWRI